MSGLKYLVGDYSGSLITAKWLLDDINIFSIGSYETGVQKEIMELFNKTSIKVIDLNDSTASFNFFV